MPCAWTWTWEPLPQIFNRMSSDFFEGRTKWFVYNCYCFCDRWQWRCSKQKELDWIIVSSNSTRQRYEIDSNTIKDGAVVIVVDAMERSRDDNGNDEKGEFQEKEKISRSGNSNKAKALNDNDDHRPWLIFHAGPPKTAATTICKNSCRMPNRQVVPSSRTHGQFYRGSQAQGIHMVFKINLNPRFGEKSRLGIPCFKWSYLLSWSHSLARKQKDVLFVTVSIFCTDGPFASMLAIQQHVRWRSKAAHHASFDEFVAAGKLCELNVEKILEHVDFVWYDFQL